MSDEKEEKFVHINKQEISSSYITLLEAEVQTLRDQLDDERFRWTLVTLFLFDLVIFHSISNALAITCLFLFEVTIFMHMFHESSKKAIDHTFKKLRELITGKVTHKDN